MNRLGGFVKSPCINICVIDDVSGLCIGCGRTRYEIAGWTKLTDAERNETIDALPERLTSITANRKRRGGRASRVN